MVISAGRRVRGRGLILCLGLAAAAGCDLSPLAGVAPGPLPGSVFSDAPVLPLDENGQLAFSNSVARGDVHVYQLGALAAGDHVTVHVSAPEGGGLDPVAAIFDAEEDLFTLNDDVDLRNGNYDAALDETIRWDSDPYYLAITPSYFGTTSGDYICEVEVTRGGAAEQPHPQTVYLNFSGGFATLQGVGSVDVPPFDSVRVDPDYDGATEEMKRIIIDVVNENFEGLDIVLLNSVDDNPPEEPFSEVFFGTFNSRAFGISESVDHWNKLPKDRSIVFTDKFDDPFYPQPSAHALAVAIGNVASHEVGHLLGLEHTADVTEIMDTTGTASTLLADVTFKKSVLDISIFPIGFQNAPKILSNVLGVTAPANNARARTGAIARALYNELNAPTDETIAAELAHRMVAGGGVIRGKCGCDASAKRFDPARANPL